MFKAKRIISLMIAVVILCLSAVPVFATHSKEELVEPSKKLYYLCWESVYDYGVSANKSGCYFKPNPGVMLPGIEYESYLKAQEVLHESDEMLNTRAANGYTEEDYAKQYDKFYDTLTSLVISKNMLNKLIAFCSEEKNDSGYYSDELWSEFCEKLENAKAVYEDPDNKKDFIVTEAYFELLHSHFKLCASNTVYGDVDNDSEVSIMDATYIQMVCAKLKDFNSSQSLIAKKDVAYASEIQRYVSSLTDNIDIANSELRNYIRYVDYSDIHSDNFRFKSWKYHFMYIDYIIDNDPYPCPRPEYLYNIYK